MSYIGTQAENPNYFANEPTSIELEGGTYNTDRLYRSSTATVTGDITLTNNLVLARITDKGNNVTLTSDGTTRTITGSGKIESGNIVTTLPSVLDGMTGTLGNTISFPKGHVIQTVFAEISTETSITSNDVNSPTATSVAGTITPLFANSTLLCQFFIHVFVQANSATQEGSIAFKIHDGSSFVYDETQGVAYSAYLGVTSGGGGTDNEDEIRLRHPVIFTTPANNISARTYTARAFYAVDNTGGSFKVNASNAKSQIIIQELAG